MVAQDLIAESDAVPPLTYRDTVNYLGLGLSAFTLCECFYIIKNIFTCSSSGISWACDHIKASVKVNVKSCDLTKDPCT